MARSPRGRQRLERCAAPLKPEQLPHHVDAPYRGHPRPGWYWQPAGTLHETYLGFNHIHAEVALLHQLELAGLTGPQEPWAIQVLLS